MRLVNRQAKISVEDAASGTGGRLLPWHCEAVLFSRRCGPSPTRRSTSSSKPKAWVMRSGYRPIGCCKTRLATSSSARSGDRRRRCAATMPAFATKPAHGQSPDEWWPRSSGIRVSFIRASALSSPTWRGRWSVSSPSITTAVPASSTSKKARPRSSGPACHADPSSPTPSASSSTRWPTISAISRGTASTLSLSERLAALRR